ncbi:unnamed protein product, partial [Effrenium voratum]
MADGPRVGLAGVPTRKGRKRPEAEEGSPRKFNPLQYYEEIRHLGSGAFGAAVLVRRLSDGRRLVAKKCSVKDMDEKQRQMCFEEIALLQKVRHECIAQLVDFVWASKDMLSYWIVLKFYSGGDVQSEIDNCRENELELPVGKAKNWVTQLCMALKHVHKLRIVHRDVKGSNMFITGARNIVLGDFGVSKQLTESQQKAMTSVGSPMYMAPEWWDGRGGTAASDMWSVGVVLFELLALRRPFEASNVLSLVHKITTEEPAALPEDADPQLAALALKLLDKRPEHRPSAEEALDKGLEDVEKILTIYREALEKKSEKRLRRLAKEEDAAAGKKPRRPSRSCSDGDSSGSAAIAGFRGINLVEIARRQAGTLPATVDEAGEDEGSEGSSDDEDEEDESEESSSGLDADESEEGSSDESGLQDSWGDVAVKTQDPQQLLGGLAGTLLEAKSAGCDSKSGEYASETLQPQQTSTRLSPANAEQVRSSWCPCPAFPEAQPEVTGDLARGYAADTLTFSQSGSTVSEQMGQSQALEKEINFTLTELTQSKAFPSAIEQVQATSQQEATCFPQVAGSQVGERTTLPSQAPEVTKLSPQEVTSFPAGNRKASRNQEVEVTMAEPQPRPRRAPERPSPSASSGSESWGDAHAIHTADGLEDVGRAFANSKTLQVCHKEPIASPKDSEDSEDEEEEQEEEDDEEEDEEAEEDEEDPEVEEVEEEVQDTEEDSEEAIEEAISMDKTKQPSMDSVQEEPCRSQPTFSVAPPLQDEEDISPAHGRTTHSSSRVTFGSWSLAGAESRPESWQEPEFHFRSYTRTTFRSSRSEDAGRSTPDTAWTRRTTLAAMSGAVRSNSAKLSRLETPELTMAFERESPDADAMAAATAYPLTRQAANEVAEPATVSGFRPCRQRRCVTMAAKPAAAVTLSRRSQSAGSAPSAASAPSVQAAGVRAIQPERPQTTGTPRKTGASASRCSAKPSLQPSPSTKSANSAGANRLARAEPEFRSLRSASEQALQRPPPRPGA